MFPILHNMSTKKAWSETSLRPQTKHFADIFLISASLPTVVILSQLSLGQCIILFVPKFNHWIYVPLYAYLALGRLGLKALALSFLVVSLSHMLPSESSGKNADKDDVYSLIMVKYTPRSIWADKHSATWIKSICSGLSSNPLSEKNSDQSFLADFYFLLIGHHSGSVPREW